MAMEQRSVITLGQRSRVVLGRIQWLFARGTVSGLSESQLLARFVGDRDEIAFEAILSRHGPMVLGVCRRLLDDPHDVEDAFQATFLVLVKKAGSLSDRKLLANWLYGVALRVATRLRRDRTRRRVRERTDVRDGATSLANDGDHGELPLVLDEEVARLPVRFRTPILLCYFEGLTHDQAAEQLQCPVGTVRSRMAKGRELLRTRLTRRGYAPATLLPTLSPPMGVIPAVPPALLSRTIAAAASVASGHSIAVGTAPYTVLTLAQGVLRAMSVTRWMTLAAVFVVLGAVGGGARVAARQLGAEPAKGAAPGAAATDQVSTARKALDELQRSIDKYQDKLDISDIEILILKDENKALKAKIQQMEVNAKPHAPTATPSQKVVNTMTGSARAVSSGSEKKGSGDDVSDLDRIARSRRYIVSQSARNDRVVIFAMDSGRSRTYRPPPGTVNVATDAYVHHVTIAAVGPRTAQFTVYDGDRDQWAIQDLPGTTGAEDQIWLGQQTEYLFPCSFNRPRLTQIALFDIGRFQWSVQDLVEPWEERIMLAPVIGEKVAVYVIGPYLYAYSAEVGRWDILKLEKRVPPRGDAWLEQRPGFGDSRLSIAQVEPITIENDVAAVSQGGHLHVFPAKTGRWQTVEPKE